MARRPAQYGTAQIKKREPVRPLLVLLLIAAGGIILFLWLQADTVDPLVTVAGDPVAAEEAAPEASGSSAQPAAAASEELDDDLADWWYDAESLLYEAFESFDDAKSGSCSDLEYALADLGSLTPRHEQPLRAPFSALVGALDSALAACRSENTPAVEGAERSARSQLKSLLRSIASYGLQSDLLQDV